MNTRQAILHTVEAIRKHRPGPKYVITLGTVQKYVQRPVLIAKCIIKTVVEFRLRVTDQVAVYVIDNLVAIDIPVFNIPQFSAVLSGMGVDLRLAHEDTFVHVAVKTTNGMAHARDTHVPPASVREDLVTFSQAKYFILVKGNVETTCPTKIPGRNHTPGQC